MALPKINESFKHVKVKLPSGKEIGVRGWKVKDEKELLFALESEDNAEERKIKYIINFLRNCTDDQVKFDTLSENDIKKVCIEVRKLAKGEDVEYSYKCKHCEMDLSDEVNLTSQQVVKEFDTVPCKINDKLIINFKDLPFKKSDELFEKYAKTEKQFTYYYVINSIEGLTINDETFTDFSEEELIEFLDDLDPDDMDKIYEKFDECMSSVELNHTVTCLRCTKDTEVQFGDLLSFLVF